MWKYASFRLMLHIHIPGRRMALMESADFILKSLGFKRFKINNRLDPLFGKTKNPAEET